MGIGDYLRDKLRNFLRIEPAPERTITLRQRLDYYGSAARNKLWYRGDSQELSDFFSQTDLPDTLFWKASQTRGLEIRKIHVGIPRLMVKVLANIIAHDYNGVEIKEPEHERIWASIAKDNSFDARLKKVIKRLLMIGDGAFKISFDAGISDEYPIIEYISGENVDFVYRRGRIAEVIFYTFYTHKKKKYTFNEYYGRGYIRYELSDSEGHEIPLDAIPQTAWAAGSEGVSFDSCVMLAVPVIFGESELFEGRGESIYEGKSDNFDALDEAWSQWMDALRAGRSKQYVPDNLIPRDPDTGKPVMSSNSFDNRFIMTAADMSEGAASKIHVEQPDIPHESYLSTYVTALDLALQGVISPSTIGIDVKKLDNAEAQREKEKTTLYTRGNIVELLSDVIPELVTAAVAGYFIWNGMAVQRPESKVNFGEYANPSFESQVETVSKGKAGHVMSTATAVEELYGNSKTEKWKEEEVRRIHEEEGVVDLGDEPSPQLDGDL